MQNITIIILMIKYFKTIILCFPIFFYRHYRGTHPSRDDLHCVCVCACAVLILYLKMCAALQYKVEKMRARRHSPTTKQRLYALSIHKHTHTHTSNHKIVIEQRNIYTYIYLYLQCTYKKTYSPRILYETHIEKRKKIQHSHVLFKSHIFFFFLLKNFLNCFSKYIAQTNILCVCVCL